MSSFAHLLDGNPHWDLYSTQPRRTSSPLAPQIPSLPTIGKNALTKTIPLPHDRSEVRSGEGKRQNSGQGAMSSKRILDATAQMTPPCGSSPLGRNGEECNDDEGSPHQRKRPKMALSCTECKRRKTKCDRNVPCAGCIKRGAADSCNWTDAKIDPTPQPFALNAELQDVQKRLSAIEQVLQTILVVNQAEAPNSKRLDTTRSQYISESEKEGRTAISKAGHVPKAYRSANIDSQERLHEDSSDAAEEAAVALESLAFNLLSTQDEHGSQPASSPGDLRCNNTSKSSPTKSKQNNETVRASSYEYTSTLTSIIESQWDSALDICNPLFALESLDDSNPQPRRKERGKVLHSLLSHLPNARQSWYLAEQYYENVDWRNHILHWASFKAELDRFWEMVTLDRHEEVDPLWLAVFFMVMALALDNRPRRSMGNNPFHNYTDQELSDLSNKYQMASIRGLYLGNAMAIPRVRTIQTILLFNQFSKTGVESRAVAMHNWTALAIRTAQLLGLHILGDDPELMPPDDPAWPPGKNAVKRHMALRTWMILQWTDWLSATTRARSYMIHPELCNSHIADNVNDWELSLTNWRYTPHPDHIITCTSFEIYRWKIAGMMRRTYDKLVTQKNGLSYSTVLELDRGYQQILKNLPLISNHEENDGKDEDQKVWRQRHLALEGIHSRIMRLHRPFLSRGYRKDSQFAYSREQCLKSARVIVDCHYNLRHITATGTFWFAYSHTLGALIVFFLDLFWSIDNDLPPAEIAGKLVIISTVQEIFSIHDSVSNSSLRKIVKLSFRIISDLASEARARLSARPSNCSNLGGQHQQQKPESFADVLKRIFRAVDLEDKKNNKDHQSETSYHQESAPNFVDASKSTLVEDWMGYGYQDATNIIDSELFYSGLAETVNFPSSDLLDQF